MHHSSSRNGGLLVRRPGLASPLTKGPSTSFHLLLDPEAQDPWFAVEAEFKLLGDERRLLIKQARPHAFSGFEILEDCREL